MEQANIKEAIQAIIQLRKEEMELIYSEYIRQISLKKNEFLLKQGQVCQIIAFVKRGSLIYYKTTEKGEEIARDFAFEGDWVTVNESRLTGKPSKLSIAALEPTEVDIIRQTDLMILYEKFPLFERLSRILIEFSFIKMAQQHEDLQILDAEERYLKLLQDYPNIRDRVPQYHIANYLGINPRSLSRIRRNRMENKK